MFVFWENRQKIDNINLINPWFRESAYLDWFFLVLCVYFLDNKN